MEITLEQIKELREKTGAGVLSCKNALIETNGDTKKAIEFLKEKGFSVANTKLLRSTKEGVISPYIHTGAKICVLLELNCETDFVARRIEFQNLAKNLAMQIAAFQDIKYISIEKIPQDVWDLEQKFESNKNKILDKLKMYTLLNQIYILDSKITVEEHIKNHIYLLGENIQINRFSKFIIGD